jgi:LysM repeat protein
MPGRSALCSLLIAVAAVGAPRATAQTDVADMREDVRGLTQRVNELSLRVEQLEHENSELRAKVASVEGSRDTVSVAQLNSAVAELNAAIKSAVASSRGEILEQVGTQMEKLAKQTNAALDSIAKPSAAAQARPAPQGPPAKPAFGDSYPKEGMSYTVQKGDTVGLIAKKTGAKTQDIIDANKLLDPSRIQAGQVLFVPGGK